MNRENHGIEINLLRIVTKLWENVKYIILATMIFGIAGYIYTSFFITPIYQAQGKMIVNSRIEQTQNITSDQLNSAKNLVGTYSVIIRSRDVVNRVIEELDLQDSYGQIMSAISVKSVDSTPVMQISVKHSDPNTALAITEKLMEIAPAMLVEKTEAGSVKEVEKAYAQQSPISPNKLRNTVLSAFIGFVITCLAIFLLVLFDNTYKTEMDIQRDLELPVLGVIPEIESCKGHAGQKKTRKGRLAK